MYINYQDLEIEQKRDLDYKINTFVEATTFLIQKGF